MNAQLKELGFRGQLSIMDSAATGAWFAARDKELAVQFQGNLGSTNLMLTAMYRSDGDRNVGHINDPELDRLIDAQGAEVKDPAKRSQLLQQVQRRILELMSVTPLALGSGASVWAPKARFASPDGPLDTGWEQVWLDQ